MSRPDAGGLPSLAFFPLTTAIPTLEQPMGRLSFTLLLQSPSRALIAGLRIFWIVLTCVAWRIVFSTVIAGHRLLSKDQVTELDRLLYNLTKHCESHLVWSCIVLLVGCVIGFLRDTNTLLGCILLILIAQCSTFIFDFLSCWSMYRILRSHGFNVIVMTCQTISKDTDLSGLCQGQAGFIATTLAIVGIIVWKLIGLSLIILTLLWLGFVLFDAEPLEEEEKKIESLTEVQENFVPIETIEAQTGDIENKV